MKNISLKSKIKIPPDVVSRRVQKEEVLLNLELGTYFGLDEIGTEIWDHVKEEKSLSQIAEKIAAEYDVNLPRAERDVLSLMENLQKNKLIEVR